MTLLLNSGETGLSSGTGVTAGNSGGSAGDSFATSIPGVSTLSTCVYSSTVAMHGSLSYKFTVKSGDSSYIQWTVTAGGSMTFRAYFYLTTTPSASSALITVRNSGGTAMTILQGSDGILKVLDAASSNKVTGWSAAALNTWWRIEGVITKGTTTSNGRIQAKYFAGDSTSATGTYDSGAAINTGTTDYTQIRWGRNGGVTTSADQVFYIDDLGAQDSSTFLGPSNVNIAPSVNAGSDQSVAVGATVTLTGIASDPDGTIAAQSWSQVSGPTVTLSGSGATRTFTPTVGNVYVFQFEATDDDAATVTDTCTVRVRDAAATIYEIEANPGAFTNQGGAADMIAALSDASDATYVESPAAPAGASITGKLTPLTVGIVTVTTRNFASSSSPSVSRLIEIVQNGSTVLASQTVNPLPTSATNSTLSTSSSVAADAVLAVRITDTQ